MANIFNYGLVGVGSSVQYGKGGARVRNNLGVIEARNAGDTAYANFQAANLIGVNGSFTGVVDLANGTAAAPALTFTSDSDTGLYSIGANQMGVSVGGNLAVRVNEPSIDASVVVFGGNSAITLPSGADAGRPTTTVAGMIRFSTVDNNVEFYNGTVWKKVTSTNSFETMALAGNFTGTNPVADSPTDTLTLTGGVGITIAGDSSSDTLTFAFTRAGMTNKTAPVAADTVALFDSASSNAPVYASFTQIFNALDVVNGVTSNGILVRTADDTYASRSIAVNGAGNLAGLAVTDGNGVSGNPTLGLNINGTSTLTSLDNADRFIVYHASGDANLAITAQNVRTYMTAAVDPLVRRQAGVVIDDAVNISTALPTTTNVYVTRIVINVTTAAVAGAGGTITDGTNTLVAAGDWDWNTVGTYVVELPVAVNSTSGQLAFDFTTAPTTAGAATVTAEYKIAA